jgi:FemAB-related protein (PEP-CTERM system-associated)
MAATNIQLAPVMASLTKVGEFHVCIGNAWEQFLGSQPLATPFHSLAWMRSLELMFGYEPRSLYAERDGKITGVLPLFLVSNWIVGRCLMSTPFADYGGVCASDQASADALVERAKQMAISERVEFLELRHRQAVPRQEFKAKSLYVGFAGELGPDCEENLKRLPRDTRYMIRKGQKAGLELRSGLDQLSVFYKLFATSWRRFGTPVFSSAWLQILAQEFQDSIDLKLAYHQNRAVAGVLSLRFRDTVFPHYAGATAESNQLAANNFIYWELMKDAVGRGLRRFDFGRSKKGTGAYQF